MKLETPLAPTPRRQGPTPRTWGLLLASAFVSICWWISTAAISSFNLHQTLLSTPSAEQARNWSAYYTSNTHLAGQGLFQAKWTEAKWKEFGIPDTFISSHDTEIPLPSGHQRVALLKDGQVVYEAPLVDGPAAERNGFVPAYFGFSVNANITGSFIFCNFATAEDFQEIARANVNIEGKIGIAKLANASPYLREHHIQVFRAAQLANAEKAGLIGLVLYTDPQNDGPVREVNGYRPYPGGVARPREAIERGGLGNADDFRRGLLPKIPCIPMSYGDAIPILAALNGIGPSARKHMGPHWQEGGLYIYGVGYHVGPSPESVKLIIVTHTNLLQSQVHNVIGTIPGRFSNEVVLVGNHRDAWGPGAGDPGSGSAALNEVVRSFGEAYQRGWRPLRTLVFTSFEGEEFAQTGSSLWIRAHLERLRASAVAYLNVVVAASGSLFHAKASPLLYRTVLAAVDRVHSPNQTVHRQSVRHLWGGDFEPPGSGDANPFLGLMCVPTVDIGFSPRLGEPVFMYHTGFDTFEWMDKIGDPEWKYHVTSAKILSLMAAQLTESPILGVSVSDYASTLQEWVHELHGGDPRSVKIDLTVMSRAIERLSHAANRFDRYAESLKDCRRPWWKFWPARGSNAKIREVNKVYMAFERQFFHGPGTDTDSNFHHALYTPSAWHNSPPPLTGLSRSLSSGHWEHAKRWRDIMSSKICDAARLLETHLEHTHQQEFPGL